MLHLLFYLSSLITLIKRILQIFVVPPKMLLGFSGGSNCSL